MIVLSNMPLIEIFTSPTCPYCPGAKAVVNEIAKENKDVVVIEHTPMTEQGRKRAQEFNISSVPTIHVSGTGTKEIFGFVGMPKKETILEMIEKVR
jgi:small redox-active disulfide protein 1